MPRTRRLVRVLRLAAAGASAIYLWAVPSLSGRRRIQFLVSASAGFAAGLGIGLYRLLSPSIEERLYRRAKQRRSNGTSHVGFELRPTFGLVPSSSPSDVEGSAIETRLGVRLRW